MKKALRVLCASIALFVGAGSATALAAPPISVSINVPMPPFRTEVRAAVPYRDAVWVDGGWMWDGYAWVWSPGYWTSPAVAQTVYYSTPAYGAGYYRPHVVYRSAPVYYVRSTPHYHVDRVVPARPAHRDSRWERHDSRWDRRDAHHDRRDDHHDRRDDHHDRRDRHDRRH